MIHSARIPQYRRWLAGVLAVLLGLGPLATPSYAAVTALADQPLNAQVLAKPNIVLTVDDSTSMLDDFLPDAVIGKVLSDGTIDPTTQYCRGMTGSMNTQCGFSGQNTPSAGPGKGGYVTPSYIFEQYNMPFGAFNSTYDPSGPGAGCVLDAVPPFLNSTCSPGIAPGPLPGLERYPTITPPPKSPKAGQPYEYWTLWPAPAHNAELNHVYYNPRTQYDPPVNADGTSYPQMNAGNTSNWTLVPADPWAATVQYVDLTAGVTIGQWCNSDWSIGHESDPAYCRTNGTGASAATSSTASADGDYSYPWAPPGIDPSTASTTASSIAYSKVDSSTFALTPAWATAQDPKYFYENDNILWCDATSMSWPQGGPLRPQLCDSPAPVVQTQTCNGAQAQICGGGTPQTCNGVTPQTCNGAQTQTCGNFQPQVCLNAVAQVCNGLTPQTCANVGTQSCNNVNPQTCNGVTPQTCTNITGQACNNVRSQVCNLVSPTCIPPDPALCTTSWDPPGVCPCVGDECPACTLTTFCPSAKCSTNSADCSTAADCPSSGTCSVVGNACTDSSQCPLQAGTCSRTGAPGCFVAGDCPSEGTCSTSGALCQNNGNCPIISGHCSTDNAACTDNTQCPNEGHCSITNAICPPNVCPVQPGQCTITAGPCYTLGVDPGECPDANGRCSVSNAVCTSGAQCPTIAGGCNLNGQACTVDANCGLSGQCSINPTVCANNAQCPVVPGTCSSSGLSCTTGANCPTLSGTCSSTGGTCTSSATCPIQNQQCSITTLPCTSTAQCPTVPGTCSITGLVCTSALNCPTQVTPGQCTITHAACTVSPPSSDPACPAQSSASGAAVCSDMLSNSVISTVVVVNAGFELPFVADYQNGPPGGAIAGATWAFTGPYTGIQRFGGSFGASSSGDGSQTATVVNIGTVSQTFTLPVGSYQLSFLAGRRLANTPVGSVNPVQILVDGVAVGTPVVPTADYQFNTFSRAFTIATAGSHTITFAGTDNSTLYKTSFIDAVTLIQGKSLLEDANTTGIVCRHNNQSGSYNSGPYSYPDATYKTPVMAGTGSNACVASPRYATVPRHYWKTGLEWCDTRVSGPSDKWLGYGTATCQDSQQDPYVWPRFYKFGQPPGTDNYATPAFARTDLIPGTTYTHDWTDSNGAEEIIRAFDGNTPDVSEMTNYANWFAYYRTRIQALKTVTSASFSEIDAKYRVGLHTMSNGAPSTTLQSDPSVFVNIADFDAAQKSAWFAQLFGVRIPLGLETPTLTSLARIGDYFLHGTHPDLSGSTDPIILSCQQNFHMLFTDGFTNQNGLPPTTVGDVDSAIPSAAIFAGFPIGLAANPVGGLVMGSDWPPPYREGAVPSLNALSDYAMAYWITDLRPGMPDNVPTSSPPLAASDRYSAKWQHLNFAALSLGTAGKLPTAQQSVTEGQLDSGALQWPQPLPSVNKPDNSGVDDLWHAAINGHGDFVNADSIDEVKLGIGKILAGVANLPGTRTAVGLVSNTFGASANFIYRVRFEPSWAGSLAKIHIDPTTGIEDPLPVWNSSDQLIALMIPTLAKPTPWNSERRIVTMNQTGAKVPFLWASLGANQQDSLAPGKPVRGQQVMDFLRGSRQKEGDKVGQLRVRTSPLGDIVDSSPVYVGAPNAAYLEANDPGYSAFAGAHSARAPQLYVGANDGMLHVFDDALGNETWAYVPTPLFRDGSPAVTVSCTAGPAAVPCGTAGGDTRAGLGALSYQDGALPAFRHHYYVDLTPKIVDVDFSAPAGTDWRTLLVGGLGKGGNRYYALDATNPSAVTNEATAAAQVLWEFPPVGDTTIDMGYTYGKPMIAKTRALFGGAWLVTVGSGYDSPSGVGKLYFLKASDPTQYKVMSTGVGNLGSPAGLTHPAGYTQDFHNQLAEQVYVGDLLGSFWRFDVSDPVSDAAWSVGQYANLIAADGTGQPVTTPPEIKIDPNNGIDRWVFVGTGRLYDDTDLADPQLQTMYALRDGTASAPWILPAPPIDRNTTGCTPDPCLVPLDPLNPANNFGLATVPAKGWYHDLPAGSRIVVAPQAAFGVIAYIATKPQTDPCLTGLPVTLYAREYGTGQSVLTTNDDGTGAIVSGVDVAAGGVGLQIVTFQGADNASAPDVRLAITMPDGTVRYFKPKLSAAFFQHRMSWRLLGQ
jgi:type IV pilus assembly protein PilY1